MLYAMKNDRRNDIIHLPRGSSEIAPLKQRVLYDEECGLCRSAVEFVHRRDGQGKFEFLPLLSPEAAGLLSDHPAPGDTLHLIDRDGRHKRSTAILRIFGQLNAPWSWLRHLRLLPRPLRDRVYDFVARRRSRGVGDPTPDACCPAPPSRFPGRR